MFAYCNNCPVIYADTQGLSCQRVISDTYGTSGIYVSTASAGGGGAATLWLLDLLEDLFSMDKSKSGKTNDGKSKEGKNGKKGQQPNPPDVEFPGNDPTKAPDGYVWKGPDKQGGKRGGYKNPNGKDSWHPDLNHPDGVDPHWDYNDEYGFKWRVFPDRIEFVGK